MDTNLIITVIGLAITVIAGIGGLIISIFTKIARLEARLDTLANDNRLQDKVDKIHEESIRKLQQRATELHDTTQTQLDHLAADIAQQQTQVHTSLEVLKAQEASSVAVLTERAQQLMQQFQETEASVQQLRNTIEAEAARLMAEIAQQRAQVKQEMEREVEALRQEKVSTRITLLEKLMGRKLRWSSLDKQWQAIFKDAIGIKSEPTEDELVRILSLTHLDCRAKKLTSLEPLRALTGLQWLNCYDNQLTSLEPLHGLKNLKILWCHSNSSLSVQEIERFKKAVPSCEVNPLIVPNSIFIRI